MKHNRLLRWLFQRSKPDSSSGFSRGLAAYLSTTTRQREAFENDLPLDISERETEPLPRIDAQAPAYEYGFYAGDTIAATAEDRYRTIKIPVFK